MLTGCSIFVVYTTLLMSNVLMDISLHADIQHRAVDLSRYQFIREIIDTSGFAIFKAQSLGEIPGEDCRLLSTIRCE